MSIPCFAATASLVRRFTSRPTGFLFVSVFLASLLLPAWSMGQVFVQATGNTVAADASIVLVTYPGPEAAGDLNVVVVGWPDTSSSVTSVVDDNTNTYVLAGTTAGNGLTQAIYYAPNIVLPNNSTPTVTVTFNQTASVPDVRILEYTGLSAGAPLDNWAGGTGISASADSFGATTSGSDLILGAGTTGSAFTAAGVGFTSRIITSPFGDIVEDINTAQPGGTYNATAPTSSSKPWVMQVIGFSVAGVNFLNPPTISPSTPITPASGSDVGGTAVTITGTNFQPGAVVLFGSAPAISGINCTESGGTTITCLTPADSDGAKDVTVVNVDRQSSSAPGAYTFQNVTPTISTITPATGPTNGGTAVTIAGGNFQVGANVLIGGLPAAGVVVQDSSTITANTPGLPAGTADVTVNNPGGGTATQPDAFTYALGTGPVNYIQRGGVVGAVTTTTVVGLLPNPQTAGNLNVVIIGWNDTVATVSSVTDTEGNTYFAALPIVTGTGLSQVFYYAANIVGDSGTPNQITVTFSQAAPFPDVQILEYSGLEVSSPIDAAAGDFGSGLLSDTGACATTAPLTMIVAGTTVSSTISGAGSGFNLLNITQPNGDSAEHQIASVAGSCAATQPLRSAGNWVTQAVAFKATPAPVPDFSVSSNPTIQTVAAGSAAAYTISVTALNGFNGAVALTCDGASLPTGASCSFAPTSVTPGTTSALTIVTSAGTPVGTANVTVTGTSGSLSHNTVVGLTVNPAPDFTLVASSLTPASVAAGGSTTSTIAVAPLNGFTGAVALSCSGIAPVVTPAPTCAFVPSSVTNGSGTSTLTVSTSTTTPTGAYTVTVSGAGSVNHTTTVNFTVTAAPVADFTIAASALSPASVSAGATATSMVTIAPVNGFSAGVNLSCSVTPVVSRVPACSFNPGSIASGSGTSVMTVRTTPRTTAALAPRLRGIFLAFWLPVGALARLATNFKPSRRRLFSALLGCLLFSGLIFLAACGGGSSGGGGHAGTPAGAYTVTVTGALGSTTHSQTVTLMVTN